MIDTLVLAGLSGTGKSTVAREVATLLGWTAIDTDDNIRTTTGLTIPEIFQREGESAFRAYERYELSRALDQQSVVIATGGGAVIAEDAWTGEMLQRPGVLTVTLDAPAEEVLARLTDASAKYGDAVKRPLLDAVDTLQKIRTMKEERATAYARSSVTLPVGGRSIAEVAADLTELVLLGNGQPSAVPLTLPGSQSTIEAGNGSRHRLARVIQTTWPRAQQIWLAYDTNVAEHAGELRNGLEVAGLKVRDHAIPSGESQKSLKGLAELYDWLLGGGVQRQDVLVALGGGKVGDLAGFAAATVLRGVGLVQLPTTLLSMVDSSIGGKTAINHPAGKNLIGAFYQPAHVLIDPELLKTVPTRELASGWAEVIKHGEIQRSTPGGDSGHLREVLRLNRQRLIDLQEPVLSWVIRQNLTIKAAVVMADEKESGLRGILNYGHTLGHAIEASGYRYLHGEAIAVGLVGAVRLAAAMDRIAPEEIDRIETLVQDFGLPIRAEVDADDVVARTASDKKKSAGKQQWVLAKSDRYVSIETDVPDALVRQVAQEVMVR